jgi:uncharacterized repeat protein (TIGR01451 family)
MLMKPILNLRTLSFLFALMLIATPASGQTQSITSSLQAPQLKWQHAGCYSSWCETGWYSSPAVADLDKDGKPEVIGSTYTIFVIDGATGSLKWHMPSGHDRSEPDADAVGRTWPGIGIADLEGNGDLEIITAHSAGYVSVYDHNGYFEPGWPQQPTPDNELRSLAIYDLEGDGDLEIIVASTRSQDQWYVYEHNGSLRAGSWPQHSPDSDANGYTAGCFNQNVAAGDLDGNGRAEIVGPNDTHYLAAFHDDGSQVLASQIYGTNQNGAQKFWSQVGVHVDHAVDLRGYANCGVEHRPNFAHSAPIVVDVNADGGLEVVVVGNIYNCGTNPYSSLYEMPYILNADRTRWAAGGFDWTAIPIPDANAAPLSEDYNLIENNQPNPTAADLDGDGNLEILFPSYDGRLHAYWLDKTEHGNWPYSVYKPAEGFYRFASEPVVADLENDGHAEVIFTSWVQHGTNQTGKLHVLDYLGNLLYEVPLPTAYGSPDWNGALAAPTLADIDGDPDMEVVVNTAHSGLLAYDLPGTSQARVLWGTGRGNYQRSGSILQGNLHGSTKSVDRVLVSPGDTLHYTVTLRNPGPTLDSAVMTDTLPNQISYAGGLTATSGSVQHTGGVVTWQGKVSGATPVVIQFDASVNAGIETSQAIINSAEISDGLGNTTQRQAVSFVDGHALHLPQINYNSTP